MAELLYVQLLSDPDPAELFPGSGSGSGLSEAGPGPQEEASALLAETGWADDEAAAAVDGSNPGQAQVLLSSLSLSLSLSRLRSVRDGPLGQVAAAGGLERGGRARIGRGRCGAESEGAEEGQVGHLRLSRAGCGILAQRFVWPRAGCTNYRCCIL